MTLLSLVYAPDPIFKRTASPVDVINDEVRQFVADMLETMGAGNAVGIAAPMVGVLKRIIVLDLHEDGVSKPYIMINPVIEQYSDILREEEEGSICFLGISAVIKRPASIKVRYSDEHDAEHVLDAEGFLACVIQHEMDYLDGVVFLDHLSKMKRDMLIKKMMKHIKHNPPHVHEPHYSH